MGAFVPCSLGLLAFLLSTSVLTVKAQNCAPGWQEYNNHCYAYFDKKLIWDAAEQEVTMISNLMAAYYTEDDNVWIGLHVVRKPTGGSEFKWTDGSPYSFTSWEYGAPHPSTPSKDCVGVTRNSAYVHWTNMDCATKKAYICKYSL